ncbi:MAG: oligosaccharide flippase family protein [Armatimonadota bacterium]|nr:oligosaccharide flippase family protein [Armatimonadota bacterium]
MTAPGRPRLHLLGGAVSIVLGEGLFFPTGLLTVAFLTRRLGPEGYGLLVLAMAPVLWVEWSIAALFARATVKLTGDAGDWRPLGAGIVRVHLVIGAAAAALLALAAGPLAALLGEPALAGYLRLFSLDVPLLALIHAHRGLLVGAGGYRQRGLASACRWTARLLLIVTLVGLGLSVEGAILGSIGASLVELAVLRGYVRPPLLGRAPMAVAGLWTYATPLFLSTVSLRLVDRLDLFMLRLLGVGVDGVGAYGAAQNLALAPRVFSLALSSLVLASLSHAQRAGDHRVAAGLVRDAQRATVVLLPLAALAAGAAPEIVSLLLGPVYAASAGTLAVLLPGAVAAVSLSVTAVLLTAAGRPGWTVPLAWAMLPLAGAGHLLAIPRAGPLGAAIVTSGCTLLGAAAGMWLVRRAWAVAPPAATAVRSLALAAGTYLVAAAWPTPGVWVLLKLAALAGAVAVGFVLLGEVRLGDLLPAWRAIARRPGLGDLAGSD